MRVVGVLHIMSHLAAVPDQWALQVGEPGIATTVIFCFLIVLSILSTWDSTTARILGSAIFVGISVMMSTVSHPILSMNTNVNKLYIYHVYVVNRMSLLHVF